MPLDGGYRDYWDDGGGDGYEEPEQARTNEPSGFDT